MSNGNSRERPGLRVLTLDAGDIRAVSQLFILKSFMNSVNAERDQPLLPAEYFDMIVGSGTGGLIGILLAIFHMDADEAIGEFLNIYHSVFRDPSTPIQRSQQLEECINDLFSRKRWHLEVRLHVVDYPTCMLAICVAAAADVSVCRKLRNYKVKEPDVDVTVQQAARAAIAFPGIFTPVRIGPEQWAREALKEACKAFGEGRHVAAIMSLGCGKSLPVSVSTDMDPSGRAEMLEIIATDCDRVAEELEDQIGPRNPAVDRFYYRFSLDYVLLQTEGHVQSTVKALDAAVFEYLDKIDTQKKLHSCLDACESKNSATLGDLIHYHKPFVATRGLPPPCQNSINRLGPMSLLERFLFKERNRNDRIIAIVSGMPGCGKTQLVIQFIRDFSPRLPVVIWIDASSPASIHAAIVNRVKELGCPSRTLKDALDALSAWNDRQYGPWLMVFNNADDTFPLSPYFPSEGRGYIIVTTRDERQASLSPERHLALGCFEPSEAFEVFSRGLHKKRVLTESEEQEVHKIVSKLGAHPVGVAQAACYARQNNCLMTYLQTLHQSRPRVLRDFMPHQQDEYCHSVYRVFDLTLKKLPPRASRLILLLSCAHHSDFPLELFSFAASHQFRLTRYNFLTTDEGLDQPHFPLLYKILCPSADWDDADFNSLLEHLRAASLVLWSDEEVQMLSIHPLLHDWARDQLPGLENYHSYIAAMTRLLASCATPTGHRFHERLLPHVSSLLALLGKPRWNNLSVNDRASFADLLAFPGMADDTVELWEGIYKEVREQGATLQNQYSAAGHLALAYETQDDMKRATDMRAEESELLRRLNDSLRNVGEHPQQQMAQRLRQLEHDDPEKLEVFLEIKILEQILEPGTRFTPQLRRRIVDELKLKRAALSLISVFDEERRFLELEVLSQELLLALQEAKGNPTDIMRAQECLAGAMEKQNRWEEASQHRVRVMQSKQQIYGARNDATSVAIRKLVKNHTARRCYEDAERLLWELLEWAPTDDAKTPIYTDWAHLAQMAETQGDLELAEKWRLEVFRRAKRGYTLGSAPSSFRSFATAIPGQSSVHHIDHRPPNSVLPSINNSVQTPHESLDNRRPTVPMHSRATTLPPHTLGGLSGQTRTTGEHSVDELTRMMEEAAMLEHNGNYSRAAAIRRMAHQGQLSEHSPSQGS